MLALHQGKQVGDSHRVGHRPCAHRADPSIEADTGNMMFCLEKSKAVTRRERRRDLHLNRA